MAKGGPGFRQAVMRLAWVQKDCLVGATETLRAAKGVLGWSILSSLSENSRLYAGLSCLPEQPPAP